jgi:hypothetical protein
MKKIITTFSFIIISTLSYCQILNFNDLKYIYEHDIESTEDYLLKKGFDFFKRENEDPTPSNQFIGKNNTYIVKQCDDSFCGFSWYQFYESKIYTSIREECKKNGYKLIKTETDPLEGSGLTYIYTDGKSKIEFSSMYKNNTTKYFITFGKFYIH